MQSRPYSPGDEQKILELFQLVFKKEMTLDFWRWRFERNPAGKHMIRLMWDNEKLVGHYAVSPVEMLCEQKPVLSALSMTTMTHPEYMGKGIFNILAKDLYQDIHSDRGVQFVWGFPNNNSHYGFIKNLSWFDINEIPTFAMKADLLRKVASDHILKVLDFTERHVASYNAYSQNYKVKVNKSLSYLRWRFLQNPIVNYDIWEMNGNSEQVAFMVTKLFPSFEDKSAFDIDILECSVPSDASVINAFLSKIITNADKPIHKVNLWLPLYDKNHILFEKVGFSNGGHTTYLGARALNGDSNLLSDLRAWYYSFSDSDIY